LNLLERRDMSVARMENLCNTCFCDIRKKVFSSFLSILKHDLFQSKEQL
jgi:hypothetical protein